MTEGTRMRRTSAILVLLFMGTTGCRGTEAQVPYHGPVATTQRAVKAAAAVGAPAAEPIASEPNAPWSIALLADIPERPITAAKRSGKVTIVQAEPEPTVEVDTIAHEADVHVAVQPDPVDDRPADEKPAAPKACSGVVNRRS